MNKLDPEETRLRQKIGWHITIQLGWIGSLLGSGVALVEILNVVKYFVSVATGIYYFLVFVILVSLHEIIERFKTIAELDIKLFRVLGKGIKNKKYSWVQKHFLNVNKIPPTIRIYRLCLYILIIVFLSTMLLLEKLADDPSWILRALCNL